MIITCFKNIKPQDKSTPTSVQPPNTAIDSQYLILQANTFIATQNNSTIRYDFVRYFDSDKTTMGFSIFWNLLHYLSKQKTSMNKFLLLTTIILLSILGFSCQDSTITENINQTIVNLKRNSKGLDENMEAAKHNILLKGYFKNKKKAADKKKLEAEQKK